jgi:hypothetical protein
MFRTPIIDGVDYHTFNNKQATLTIFYYQIAWTRGCYRLIILAVGPRDERIRLRDCVADRPILDFLCEQLPFFRNSYNKPVFNFKLLDVY